MDDNLKQALLKIAEMGYVSFTGTYPVDFVGQDANEYRKTLREIRNLAILTLQAHDAGK